MLIVLPHIIAVNVTHTAVIFNFIKAVLHFAKIRYLRACGHNVDNLAVSSGLGPEVDAGQHKQGIAVADSLDRYVLMFFVA